MATQSPTKDEKTKPERKPAGFVAKSDELLAKDLPRNDTPGQHAGHEEATLKPVSLDVPADRAPSSVRKMPTPRPEDHSDPRSRRPAEATAPKAPQRPHPRPSASPVTAPTVEPPPQTEPLERLVRPPSSIARLSGHTLRLPSGVPLAPGKRVAIEGQEFEIRPEESFRGLFWAKSLGILTLTILAAVGVAYVLSGPTQSSIIGVVVDRQTKQILPNATVSMADGRVARTNQAGIFQFEGVEPEQYVLTASARGYESQNGFIEPEAGKTDQLSFALAPQLYAGLPAESDSTGGTQSLSDGEQTSDKSASSQNHAVGTVELAVDFDGYMVFVDGELYGKNSSEVKRLSAGTHKILLQMDGFQDYSTTVEVKARATSTVKIKKSDLTPRIDPIKRSRGLFAEGKNYLDSQEWGSAVHLFDQALEYDSDYAEAYQYRGWAYLKVQKQSEAMEDFKRAADLYDQAKRYIDAVACAKYLIEIEPKNPANWRRRADYNLALSDFNAAIRDYEQAVKIDKKSLISRMALGEALFAAGHYDDAAKEFDRARRLADDPSIPYIRMILSYYNAGELDDVEKKYKDFSEVAPPELMQRLRDDPEWLKILQVVGGDERTKN